MKTIYLFRHGEVEDEYRDRVRGSGTDCNLSPEGERMSLANIRFLVQKGVKKVITTGMKRTDFVGTHLSGNYEISHTVDSRLREMDMGEWEGQLLDDVNAAYPIESVEFMKDPLSGVFPGLESPDSFQERVHSAWDEILISNDDQIAVIAHGITNTAILRRVLGDKPHPLRQTIGCMNQIEVKPPPRIIIENKILY